MLRALLKERFQLESHIESRTLPVYVLSIAKGGPTLGSAPPDRSLRVDINSNGPSRTLSFEGASSAVIARNLSSQLKQGAVDRTGLSGHYNGELEWFFDLDDASSDSSGPSIFTAIQRQLGLCLQTEKTPVNVLVIDRVSIQTGIKLGRQPDLSSGRLDIK